MTSPPSSEDLLAAYAEIAERRARRITELVNEREELRRRLSEGGGARSAVALEKRVAALERDLRRTRAQRDRILGLLPVRALLAIRRRFRSTWRRA